MAIIFALSVLDPRSSGVWAATRAICLEGWEWVRSVHALFVSERGLFILFLGAHVWIVHRCRTGILLGKTRALLSPWSPPAVWVTVRVHASDRGDGRPLMTLVRFS